MVKPRTKILASIFLALLALALAETISPSVAWTNRNGTEIGAFDSGLCTLYVGKPWSGIGLKGAIRMWNGTVGTHEGGLQKWPMYWFISFGLKRWIDDNETFIGGCLVIENWQQAYGWRTIAVTDAKAHGMKIIVVDFETLADISYQIDRWILIKSYLSKSWIPGDTLVQKQLALDYFNEIWQTDLTIEEILANQGSPWT